MENKEDKVIPFVPVNNEGNTIPVMPVNNDVKLETIGQQNSDNQVNVVESMNVQEFQQPQVVSTAEPSQTVVQQVQPVSPVQPVQTVTPIQENTPVIEEVKSDDTVSAVKPIVDSGQNGNGDDDNKGPSTFSKIMTTLLFLFLFAFVYFLGDITDFINQKKLEKEAAGITSGRLVCNNTKETETLDIKINAVFTFENSKITMLTHTTTSTGDKTQDKEELQGLLDSCKLLKEEVKKFDGVSVVCSLNNGINSVKQTFDYSKLEMSEISSAFAEAGGVYPQFQNGDDINSVESKMISSDYSCEKIGN